MKFAVFAAAAMLSLGASGASAATYDIVGSFKLYPADTSPFSYGYNTSNSSFIAYDAASPAICGSLPGIACDFASSYNRDVLPAVGINTTGAPVSALTVTVPTNVLFLHPVGANSGLAAGDTIVRFTAPTTSTYKLNGSFMVLDVATSGVNVSINGPSGTPVLASYGLGGAWGTSKSFDNTLVQLSAGQTLDFVVNSAGSYYNDSTGLSGTISAVPEPTSWAMMVGGFGLVGGALRRRQRSAVRFA